MAVPMPLKMCTGDDRTNDGERLGLVSLVAEYEALGPGGSRNPSRWARILPPNTSTSPRKSRSQGKIVPRLTWLSIALRAEGTCQIRCQLDTKMLGAPNIFQFLFFLLVNSMQTTVMAPYKPDRKKRKSAPRCLIALMRPITEMEGLW